MNEKSDAGMYGVWITIIWRRRAYERSYVNALVVTLSYVF